MFKRRLRDIDNPQFRLCGLLLLTAFGLVGSAIALAAQSAGADAFAVQDVNSAAGRQFETVAHLSAMGVAAVIIIASVFVHYEALRLLSVIAKRIPIKPRARVMIGIFYIVILHFIEIWFFAFGFVYLDGVKAFGKLAGMGHEGIMEYVYFSAVCYSTLGFGDIVPEGPLRLLCAAEALLGLIMITWSASYTYLQMQRHWHPDRD